LGEHSNVEFPNGTGFPRSYIIEAIFFPFKSKFLSKRGQDERESRLTWQCWDGWVPWEVKSLWWP